MKASYSWFLIFLLGLYIFVHHVDSKPERKSRKPRHLKHKQQDELKFEELNASNVTDKEQNLGNLKAVGNREHRRKKMRNNVLLASAPKVDFSEAGNKGIVVKNNRFEAIDNRRPTTLKRANERRHVGSVTIQKIARASEERVKKLRNQFDAKVKKITHSRKLSLQRKLNDYIDLEDDIWNDRENLAKDIALVQETQNNTLRSHIVNELYTRKSVIKRKRISSREKYKEIKNMLLDT